MSVVKSLVTEQIWITNDGIADLCAVFARTSSPAGKITASVPEAAWPAIGHRRHAVGVGCDKKTTPMPQLLCESAGIYGKYTVERDRPARFMLDKGSYPWDVVQ